MLSNTEIARYAAKHRGADLLHPSSFFTWLLGQSLSSTSDVADAPRPDATNHTAIFRALHKAAKLRRDETVSGPGATLAQTEAVRAALPALVQRIGVTRVLDAGCGDHNWLRHVALLADYVGVDLLPEIVKENCRRFPHRRFTVCDLTREAPPRADLVVCRDLLGHYDDDEALAILRNLRCSGAEWLLATTFARDANKPGATGGWRPISLQRRPFGFPPPCSRIVERCAEAGGIYGDKSLGLWRLQRLPISA